mgnify:FL=1
MAELTQIELNGTAYDIQDMRIQGNNASAKASKFAIIDGSGNINYRTASQVFTDIGVDAAIQAAIVAAINSEY